MTCAQGLLRLLWGGPEVGVLRDWPYVSLYKMHTILWPPKVASKMHRSSGSFDLVKPDHNKGVFEAAEGMRLACTDQESSDLFFHASRNAC